MGKGGKEKGGRAKQSAKSREDVDVPIKKGKGKYKRSNKGSKKEKNYGSREEVEFSNHLRSLELAIHPRLYFNNGDEQPTPTIATIHGFTVFEMPSDGNCMFHSIADQMNLIRSNYGSNTNSRSSKCNTDHYTHNTIRQHVIGHIGRHQEYFKAFHWDEDESFAEYIIRMHAPGEWGGNSELVAASRFLQCNIYIFQHESLPSKIEFDPTDTNFNPQSKATIKRRIGHRRGTGMTSTSTAVSSESFPNIFLSFHGDCHYNSLHPARIEDNSGKPIGVLHSVEPDDGSSSSGGSTDLVTATGSQPTSYAGAVDSPEEFSLDAEATEREKAEASDDLGSAGAGGEVAEAAARVRFDKRKQKAKGGEGNTPVLSKKEQRKLAKMFARQASMSGGDAATPADRNSCEECEDGIFTGDMVII